MDAPDIEKLRLYGIDYMDGVERFGGNEAMFEKFVRRFVDDSHFEELQGLVEANNVKEAFRCAHTLKGIVGNLSFTHYFDAISKLDEALRDNKLDDAYTAMTSVAKAHYKVIAALNEI